MGVMSGEKAMSSSQEQYFREEVPHNDFLWSHTRHEVFQSCLRRYYYAYYLAWGGWLDSAPAAVRELYILKRLFTRQDWVATHVSMAIAHLLRSGTRPMTPGLLAAEAGGIEARQIENMREEFLHSRSGAFRADPVHMVGLFEHVFEVPVTAADWKQTVDRLALAIRTFAGSTLAQDLFALPKERLIFIDRPLTSILNGFKVRAHPSLLILDHGQMHLYLWEAHPEVALTSLRERLAIHACLADTRNRTAVNPVTDPDLPVLATAYSPLFDESYTLEFTPTDIGNTREFIVNSADEMLFPLAKPEENDPGDGAAFEPSPSPGCAACPFHRVCPAAEKS